MITLAFINTAIASVGPAAAGRGRSLALQMYASNLGDMLNRRPALVAAVELNPDNRPALDRHDGVITDMHNQIVDLYSPLIAFGAPLPDLKLDLPAPAKPVVKVAPPAKPRTTEPAAASPARAAEIARNEALLIHARRELPKAVARKDASGQDLWTKTIAALTKV